MAPDITRPDCYKAPPYIAEILREKTPEERLQARDEFLKMVRESTAEEDAAVDELFRIIRQNRQLENWDHTEAEEEIA